MTWTNSNTQIFVKTGKLFSLLLLLFATSALGAQTIAEKKAGNQGKGDLSPEMQQLLQEINRDVFLEKQQLNVLYAEAKAMHRSGADEAAFAELIDRMRDARERIQLLELKWQSVASWHGQDASYGLWHEPETTLGQLVIDYGSFRHIYVMNPEIADIPLSINSSLPIPKSSWEDILEWIISENGIGYRDVNPFLRELYFLSQDRSQVSLITADREDLETLPPEARVCFVLIPKTKTFGRTWSFLQKFAPPKTSTLTQVGQEILIFARVVDVKELLKIYDFILEHPSDREYKAISLRRVKAVEMAKILSAIFGEIDDAQEGSDTKREKTARDQKRVVAFVPEQKKKTSLKIIALGDVAEAIFLLGPRDEIRRAEEIIYQIEGQVGEAKERVIFTYMTKHSDPEELAEVLEKIYMLLVESDVNLELELELMKRREEMAPQLPPPIPPQFRQTPPPMGLYDEGYYLDDRFIVNPNPGEPRYPRDPNINQRGNFIVDFKTGAIVMVIEVDLLPKFKELIKKIDVPKKMVRIEVLLFEKIMKKEDQFGLNLLRMGTCASNSSSTCARWNDVVVNNQITGIFEFLLSRPSGHGMPAYDLAYKFLLSQDDIQINACPSVLAINQTTARIEINDEISVNTGVFVIPIEGSNTLKNAFARARYGIEIEITPTIHESEDTGVPNYVTLDTNILFETPQRDITQPDRPVVTRRKIVNQVRIEDGQTVILGGLRRKDTQDSEAVIPFLGEIPGVGKFFSNTLLTESSNDIFIFLTPKIISDPGTDLNRIRCIEMTRRPGDIPEFMYTLVEAQECEKNRLFQHTMNMLFGLEKGRYFSPYCEGVAPTSCLYEGFDGREQR